MQKKVSNRMFIFSRVGAEMTKYLIAFYILLSLLFLSVLAGKTVEDFRVTMEKKYERGDTAVAFSYKKVRLK